MIAAAVLAAQLAYPMFDVATNHRLAKAPSAVGALIERKAECEHWAGEDPYDKARRREIEQAVTALHCDRIDSDEAGLRRRYRASPAVLKLLDLSPDGG